MSERMRRVLAVLLAVVVLLGLGVLTVSLMSEEARKNQAQDKAAEKAEQVQQIESLAARLRAACDGGDRLSSRLHRAGLCGEAREVTDDLTDEQPAPGLTTADRLEVVELARQVMAESPSLTAGQVAAEVAEQLARNRPADGESGRPGRPGEDGADGGTPSPAQVRAIVEAVYAANPPPPGQDGDDGSDGADGLPGEDGADGAPGEPGPPGPPGETGPQGEQGPPGPQGQPGSVQPGTYDCGEGEYVTGFDVGPLGAVTLHCQPLPAPPEPEPTTPPEPTPTTEP